MRDLGRHTSPDIRQIDLDVLRTFRNHIMFRERYGIKQQALFHVLVAYSMYNPVSCCLFSTVLINVRLILLLMRHCLLLQYMYLMYSGKFTFSVGPISKYTVFVFVYS